MMKTVGCVSGPVASVQRLGSSKISGHKRTSHVQTTMPRARNISVSAGVVEDATPSDGEVVPILALPPADERYSGINKVLVAGATGGVGKAVVKQLASQGIAVRALVRDAVKASSRLPGSDQNVEIVEADVASNFNSVRRAVGSDIDAIICCTGPTDRFNPLAPFQVDFQGTENLIAAAKQAGTVKKIIYVSSIGADDILFPLNAFWGVLFWKKQGELAIQRSGIDYTIIRPGGLLNEIKNGRGDGGVVAAGPDAFGLPPRRMPGSILRSDVADGCIVALVAPEASNKVVEVITEKNQPRRAWAEVFASVSA
jgi:uncharacterized protein YbjT (DUF2867 family)